MLKLMPVLLLISSYLQLNAAIEHDSLFCQSLVSNLYEEPARREILVYLPPDYNTVRDRNYPVLYLLHSYNSSPASWLGENGYEDFNLATCMDSLISAGIISGMIIVMPDANNRFGGSWYTNSSSGGRWMDFITEDLVQYIDSKYRTKKNRESRSISGQSMGGYGALHIAMNRPDVFGSVLAISAVNLVNPDPFGESVHDIVLNVNETNLDSSHLLGRLFWSKAVAFSPNPDSKPFYADLPFRKVNGVHERVQTIWDKWQGYALINRIQDHKKNLQQLHIRLDVGNNDPLKKETTDFADMLAASGINYQLKIFEGGHVKGVARQLQDDILPFFNTIFSSYRSQKGIETY